MEPREPITINTTDLRIKTRDLMERVKFNGERFIVETFGRPMVVIISLDDFMRVKEILCNQAHQVPDSHSNDNLTMACRNNEPRKIVRK